jgi:hypothetical protein
MSKPASDGNAEFYENVEKLFRSITQRLQALETRQPRGITHLMFNHLGHLSCIFTDGQVEDLGPVRIENFQALLDTQQTSPPRPLPRGAVRKVIEHERNEQGQIIASNIVEFPANDEDEDNTRVSVPAPRAHGVGSVGH